MDRPACSFFAILRSSLQWPAHFCTQALCLESHQDSSVRPARPQQHGTVGATAGCSALGYAFADHEDGVLQVMSRILEAHRMVHGEPLPALMLRGCVSSQLAGEGAAARGTSPLVLTHSHTCGCAAARAGLACWQNLWSAEAFVGRLVNVHVHLSQGLARIWRIFLSRSLSELQLSWRDIALHFSWKA